MDTISPKEKKMIEELHSGKYLAFAILLLAAAGIRIISVITMFSIDDYLVGSKLVMLAIDWIVFIIPFVIMGIGMLLTYINAGKGILGEGYLNLIKKAVAVRGVRTSIHMIFIALFGLSCCLPTVFYLSEIGYKELETTAMLVCIAMIVISSYGAFVSIKYIQGLRSMIEDTPGVFCFIKRKRMFIPWIISAIIFNVLMLVVLIMYCVSQEWTIEYVGSWIQLYSCNGQNSLIFEIVTYLLIVIFLGRGIPGAIVSIISKLLMIAIFVMTIIVRKRIHDIAQDAEETADNMESDEPVQTVHEPVIIPDHSQDEQATTLLSADPSVSSLKQESVKPSVVNKIGTIRSLNSVDGEFAYPVNDGEELVIGKDASVSSIIVGNEYDTVSRKHCGIMYVAAEDNYRVIDYSTNGTYLNGKKMDKGVYQVVAKGTVLSIANDKIRYRLV